jgi:hypothetical protein
MSSLPSSHASCATLCYSLYKCILLLSGLIAYEAVEAIRAVPSSAVLRSRGSPSRILIVAHYRQRRFLTPLSHLRPTQVASNHRVASTQATQRTTSTRSLANDKEYPVEGYMILGSIAPISVRPAPLHLRSLRRHISSSIKLSHQCRV